MDTSTHAASRGTIFVSSRAAASILARGRLLSSDAWLDGWGTFADGDPVYLVARGGDGGQRVLCRAQARCDAQRLHALRVAQHSLDGAPAFVIALVVPDAGTRAPAAASGDTGD